jgi:hypothetical protein
MPQTVQAVLETLFASPGEIREPVTFDWRLIRRKGRPLLLLPLNARSARTGLTLYSAQRRLARIWRALLPGLLRTPAAGLFKRVRVRAAAASELMQFLAQQAGVPANELPTMAIKLSEVGVRSRVVLLVCDESGRPARVVKIGLNAQGRLENNREADFLAQLPADTLGCIRMVGRLTTPTLAAFATDYFPGASPKDDAGMEHLFHAWLNPGPLVALNGLPLWAELAAAAAAAEPETWRIVNAALAEKAVRPTLYHGDFAPWNIRAISSRNLEAFDWERGSLQGVPGWDWFHFVVQTAILARRHSVERVAAEVEQLIHSPRFKKYAAEAGISDLVQPLLLAYALHQRWVVQPQEGGQATAELFELLAEHWQLQPPAVAATPAAPVKSAPGLWTTAGAQLKSALILWRNLFWEPQLNATMRPSLAASFQARWPFLLLAGLLLGGLATAQYFANANLITMPFYLGICALVTWQTDRRWGTLVAALAAVLRTVVQAAHDPGYELLVVGPWNITVRFVILQMSVLFVDRIHQQAALVERPPVPPGAPATFAETWAVILASGGLFALVAGADWLTNPQFTYLPLYVFPCMLITLVVTFNLGLVVTLLAAFTGTFIEQRTTPQTSLAILGWNFAMRLAIYLAVLVLVNRLRRQNFLFVRRKSKTCGT